MILDKLRQKNKDPSVNPYLRMMDPDIGMPDMFYMMDEIGRVQVLRRFQKREDDFVYCGTFEVLHKTERGRRFCVVMRRRKDERLVPPEHAIESPEELNALVVAEYYPGVMSRIYLRGLGQNTMQSVVDEYVQRMCRKRRIRGLLGWTE